jgi:hypothetical protein
VRTTRSAFAAACLIAVLAACQAAVTGEEGDIADLAHAECITVASAWDLDMPTDAPGAASPEEAIEAARESAFTPIPRGEGTRIVMDTHEVVLAFTEGEQFTGMVTVARHEGTWHATGAIVCAGSG